MLIVDCGWRHHNFVEYLSTPTTVCSCGIVNWSFRPISAPFSSLASVLPDLCQDYLRQSLISLRLTPRVRHQEIIEVLQTWLTVK